MVCDANLMILDVVALWPGRTHDAFIWNNSRLSERMERGEMEPYWLLGDAGYGCHPYLLTPLADPVTAQERRYQEAHVCTRNAIERCNAILKRRFRYVEIGNSQISSVFCRSLNKKAQGKRYSNGVKQFYETLLYIGGARIVKYVSANMLGPYIHSVHLWRQTNQVIMGGTLLEDFKQLVNLYSLLVAKTNKVPVQLGEDEDGTSIVSKVSYDQKTDSLTGFCGENGPNRQCQANFSVIVGDGEDGYNVIREAFARNRIGTYASAILVNPLHPDLPRVPIVLHPTCNKFDSDFVSQKRQQIDALYKAHLVPVLGPLIGHSSDGDSRRRKVMLHQTRGVPGVNRIWPIQQEDFTITCCREHAAYGYVIQNIPDQDFVHNVKKLVNVPLHSSRRISCGQYQVHMNQIELVMQTFPAEDHGLTLADFTRDDRQNHRSCEKVALACVLNCVHWKDCLCTWNW